MNRMFTPDEVIKVIDDVVAKCNIGGYKAGWGFHEMKRRASAAESKGSFYGLGTSPEGLGYMVLNIINGEDTRQDVYANLKDQFEMYMESENV